MANEIRSLPIARKYIPKRVNRNNWKSALSELDNQRDLDNFLDQYEEGINIGMDHIPTPTKARTNPRMDLQSQIKLGESIIKWHKKGYTLGPFLPSDPFVQDCRINPIFAVPKPDGTARPVVNYSKVINGRSVNDMLYPEWCTVEYIKIQEIVFIIQLMGIGAKIWAKDLEDGYFNIKINPSQMKVISFTFLGLIFVPIVLVFGLSSAPLIFTVFMGYVLQAIRFRDKSLSYYGIPAIEFDNNRQLFQQEIDIIRIKDIVYIPLIMAYLDDIFGVHREHKVQKQYQMAGTVLRFLGLSAKEAKDRPPNTTQIILGLEYDTIKQEVRTPKEKVEKYSLMGQEILENRKVKKRVLFSFTGKIRHAAGQCKPLAAYARGIEEYGKGFKWDHRIHINRSLRKDIKFTIDALQFAAENGVSFKQIIQPGISIQVEAFTDATSKYGGIGGWINEHNGKWFQVHWKQLPNTTHLDILWKEMAAVAVAIDIYRDRFAGKFVRIWTDNDPVKWMLLKWRSKPERTDLQGMIRFIADICVYWKITPWWDSLSTTANVTADRLSRFHKNPWEHSNHQPYKIQSKSATQSIEYLIDKFGYTVVPRSRN